MLIKNVGINVIELDFISRMISVINLGEMTFTDNYITSQITTQHNTHNNALQHDNTNHTIQHHVPHSASHLTTTHAAYTTRHTICP